MPEAAGTGDARYLVFTLGPDDFALDLGVVRELIRPPRLTRVPGAPAALAGLANLRGLALPVLDLRRVLRPDAEPAAEPTRVVVAEAGEPVGLMIDRVLAFSGGAGASGGDDQPGSRRIATSVGSGRARLVDLAALVAEAFPERKARPAASFAGLRTTRGGDGGAAERIALVSFNAAGRSYALPLERVAEVLALPPDIVPVPRAGEAALGVVARRGGVLPLLALPTLLGLVAPRPGPDARIVVARIGGSEVGLVVDALGPILRLAPDAVDPVPAALGRGRATAVEAICRVDGDGTLVSVLSTDRLLEGTTVTANPPRSADTTRSNGETGGRTEQFVVFDVAGESYGVPVASVREVLRVPATMTRLPRSPDIVAGAVDVRGTVLAVVDQRRRFGLPPGEDGPRRRIIVLEAAGNVAGLLVDGVSRMLRLEETAIRPTPGLSDEAGNAVDRVATLDDGGLLPIVDAQALLAGTERSVRAATKTVAHRAPGSDAPA
ncbi:purine-binding chemotaxis protein CheW [Methylobacterium phyllostachyos]|uniref:Purine-binding chemotaxis protein CheW n=1 Tax=Methylobacterium phyllostachyos TaxID=582672 RepID=A0A1G9U855_9HYPH|nr:chemotaxis protein CheW [Methylobacterium phyllostachyos]SDM56121.1 purine-binding chemotaxis protein CheW [Methylobacterium phyllostachyos]